VCNYLTAGNKIGDTMYKVGEAGFECSSKSVEYPALCTFGYSNANLSFEPIESADSTTSPISPVDSLELNAANCAISAGLNGAQIQTILNTHNALRNRVAAGQQGGQPSAGDMHQIYWDQNLANIAQNWANRCTTAHNPSSGAGENIYWYTSGSPQPINVAAAVQLWYNEVGAFPASDIGNFQFIPAASHYTQLAWGRTSRVGKLSF
jgi:hypothetical protein